MPDNAGEAVKLLAAKGEARRVAIVRRPDGLFAIRPEKLTTARFHPELIISEKWIPLDRASGLFASPDLAEREAYALYPWIRPKPAEAS